ncbi:MAG: N-acylglucosamine 2-epimerase [Bacteroidetes bacterium]|jgi:mannose 2-epimerase|nr:N-acylglucosamine 2-epimerase [Bacteroidota bacterium]MBT3748648.1 N-acylglucosamine 2-epimerase [Bacteroidota bacterium]MBT4400666.1 N-acylglucosamine 2-epimerase [Bacteroidota bacterium]MBT4410949.1 N-acylglucosamine 2-epimerase [Bacteroidota bacterium]MBT5426227.1 N-acylglucosamine 2-epimerase [Bacteroidota bacterium]
MQNEEISKYLNEAENHLRNELLPFWTNRMIDERNGGYITHFDRDGLDTGEDEKSLIAQSRSVYTLSSAHRAGYGDGALAGMAKHGVNFMIDKMWDKEYGGFYWMMDRKGNVQVDKKILYGLSFAIYSLSEYTLATGDTHGREYAEKTFDLIQKNCTDTYFGGYFEMFDRNWSLAGPGSKGGDRKTLDVHMHLMEAFTTLFECSNNELHRRKLLEDIEILLNRIMHPRYKTGIPQYFPNWKIAPQIKFDIIWGWDRFSEEGEKDNSTDNTCYGHNAEFAWLLIHALKILGVKNDNYQKLLAEIFEHTIDNGIDKKYGGVFVEGPHSGGVYDMEKEFWQQAEIMIGALDAYLMFGKEKFWDAYKNVHRFVFDKVINHKVGEWFPLLTREGKPIWDHMSHSWKVNYHTVRAMIQSIERLKKIS